MAVTVDSVVGGHEQETQLMVDIARCDNGMGADVSNALLNGQYWFKCDLTGDENDGEFDHDGAGICGATCYFETFLFHFDADPTRNTIVCREQNDERSLTLTTDNKLAWYDGSDTTTGDTVLADDTDYEIAVYVDYSNGAGGATREVVWLDKAIEIDVTSTAPNLGAPAAIGYVPMGMKGEALAAATNSGCNFYYRNLVRGRCATGDQLYQWQVAQSSIRADGDYTGDWTKSNGAQSEYQHVDEVPGNTSDYLSAASTDLWFTDYGDQRATVGIAATDTIDKTVVLIYHKVLTGSTKWGGYIGWLFAAAEFWYDAAEPSAADWEWDAYTLEDEPSPSDLDDWQIGCKTHDTDHNIEWGVTTFLAQFAYRNSSHALSWGAVPRTQALWI